MKDALLLFITLFIVGQLHGQSQNNRNMREKTNPLLCDPETGICEMPGYETTQQDSTILITGKKPVKLIYYTDPICSSCWGIEPQLRKLKLEYGNVIDVEYRMGGLLKDWSYNSGGISKPADVAGHWDEVSGHYDMPIDGDVWLEDPLSSSYPPSIAFKAAQLQDQDKAISFLREIREMVFLHKKNITKWEYLEAAAKNAGIETVQFKADYEGRARLFFEADLQSARESGVRGFPSIFFTDTSGKKELVYGARPYTVFENALLRMYPAAVKANYDNSWAFLFFKYPTLTAKEFALLSGMERSEGERFLDKLAAAGQLEKQTTKNGAIWKVKRGSR